MPQDWPFTLNFGHFAHVTQVEENCLVSAGDRLWQLEGFPVNDRSGIKLDARLGPPDPAFQLVERGLSRSAPPVGSAVVDFNGDGKPVLRWHNHWSLDTIFPTRQAPVTESHR
jgi:hypothetical protein